MKYIPLCLIVCSALALGVASEAEVTIGAFIPPTGINFEDNYEGDVDRINTAARKDHGILMHYRGFDNTAADSVGILEWASDAGAVPFVNCNVQWSYSTIINGDHDAYFDTMAQAFSNFSDRILLCLDSEMDLFGKDPSEFIAMWKRVHDIFDEKVATNIEWVWSPNWSSTAGYTSYYPGDDYVDWVGTVGFNWNDGNSAGNLFDSILNGFASNYPNKPAIISYTGASQTTTNKVNWIMNAYNTLPNHGNLKAIVWWNDSTGSSDFRVTPTSYKPSAVPAEVTTAYGDALRSSTYISALPPYDELVEDLGPSSSVYIDLSVNKYSFSTSDYISITANVQPISTPFHPYVRIIFPNGTALYYVRDSGFTTVPTPYLGGGPFVLNNALSGYSVLATDFSIAQTGTFTLEGYPTNAGGGIIGSVDTETLTVQ